MIDVTPTQLQTSVYIGNCLRAFRVAYLADPGGARVQSLRHWARCIARLK